MICRACKNDKSKFHFYRRSDNRQHSLVCKECSRAYQAKRRKELPDYHRKRYLKKYGLTIEQYRKMLSEQNGVCAMCFNGQKRALSVDHDHRTNRVRALLCGSCNALLGLAKESKIVLEAAIDYLDKHNHPA